MESLVPPYCPQRFRLSCPICRWEVHLELDQVAQKNLADRSFRPSAKNRTNQHFPVATSGDGSIAELRRSWPALAYGRHCRPGGQHPVIYSLRLVVPGVRQTVPREKCGRKSDLDSFRNCFATGFLGSDRKGVLQRADNSTSR